MEQLQQNAPIQDDYSRPDAFGQVRLFSFYVPSGRYSSAGVITSLGWHRVNRLYHVKRPEGSGEPLLLFTVSGHGSIRIQDRWFTVGPEALCLIPAWTDCAYTPAGREPWEFYWIHFRGDYAESLMRDILDSGGNCVSYPSGELLPHLEACLTASFQIPGGELQASSILHRLLEAVLLHQQTRTADNHLVSQIVQYLNEASLQMLSMEELEQRFHYSREHIIRQFRKQLNTTPYHYWRQMKMGQARQLLISTNYSIEKLAKITGYSSIDSFSKQFRLLYGMTPRQMRKQNQAKSEEN